MSERPTIPSEIWITVSEAATLVLSALIGVALYLGMVRILKVNEINDLISLMRRKMKKA